MIRKVFHIIMVFVLLVSLSGVSLHRHYCKGELTGFSVYVDPEPCCGSSCANCSDEVTFEKLDTDLVSVDIQHLEKVYPPQVSMVILLTTMAIETGSGIPQHFLPATLFAHFSSGLHGITMLGNFRL